MVNGSVPKSRLNDNISTVNFNATMKWNSRCQACLYWRSGCTLSRDATTHWMQADSRNQRSAPKRRASLPAQTSTMPQPHMCNSHTSIQAPSCRQRPDPQPCRCSQRSHVMLDCALSPRLCAWIHEPSPPCRGRFEAHLVTGCGSWSTRRFLTWQTCTSPGLKRSRNQLSSCEYVTK
jgi:hypothetical protein